MIHNTFHQFSHILQAGFTVRSFEESWENFEWNQDDHFEDLWERGEAESDSFSQSSLILEPGHYQSLFLIMGFMYSLGLIVLLWDIIENPNLEFLTVMQSGLSACLLITFVNLFFFSTALWMPITRDTMERKDKWGNIAKSAKTISTNKYQFDQEILGNNKTVAFAIFWYGAVLSFVFVFVAMIRSLGRSIPPDK